MSLRIIAPQAGDRVRLQAAEASTPVDSYMERLVKLFPAEAASAFPLLMPLTKNVGPWAVWVVAWTLLVVVVAPRWHATATPERGPQWPAVAIAAVSFVIWV